MKKVGRAAASCLAGVKYLSSLDTWRDRQRRREDVHYSNKRERFERV